MKICVMAEPQDGATYGQQLALAVAAEEFGLDGYFRFDDFLSLGGPPFSPSRTETCTLAGLARESRSIRSAPDDLRGIPCSLNSGALPEAQVNEMSGGRIEFGLGAGRFEREHLAFGLEFLSVRLRLERLEEQLQITRDFGPATERPYSLRGKIQSTSELWLSDSVRNRPRLIVGGNGCGKTIALAAKYADE